MNEEAGETGVREVECATRKYFMGDEDCLAEALYQTFRTPFPRLKLQIRLLFWIGEK